MLQDVYAIGATGKVGSTLVRQLIKKGDTSDSHHANPTRIIGLASSTHTIYLPRGISPQQAYAFITRNYIGAQKYQHPTELLEIVNQNRNNTSTLVFVDVTAVDEPMTGFHMYVIKQTPHSFVTANKIPLASHDFSTFQQLTRYPRRYGYRCSVMAGADAVPYLQDLRDLNDTLYTIEGCFSGTIGNITSELEKNIPFSKSIRESHAKGYTEPHPRDDLSGLDVAKKLVILARTAGYSVDIKDVEIEPFIPKEFLFENDVNHFLDSLAMLDREFTERMNYAKVSGKTLRYVARMDAREENPKLKVSLQEVPRESYLGQLEGTKNKLVIISEAYPDGYIIEAIGAGLDVTARNIRRDLLNLLPERSF